MTQLPFLLLDADASRAALDRSLARQSDALAFLAVATDAIRATARAQPDFIVDDVWRHMPDDAPAPRDKRAMGLAMRQAASAGLIRATDGYRQSAQVRCHANPRRVWRRA